MAVRKTIAAVGLCLPLQVLACDFPAGFFFRQEVNPGDLFVGRDAPIGSEIRPLRSDQVAFSSNYIRCALGTRFDVDSPMPKLFNSSLVPPGEVILQTRIPGIGVVVSAHILAISGAPEMWTVVPGLGAMGFGVPHHLTLTGERVTSLIKMTHLRYRIIKTGPIDPGMGPQSLAGHTLAEFNHHTAGKVLEMVFTGGSINIALCGLPSAPGTQISVPMGTWNTKQFSSEGSVTEHSPFSIPLRDCQAGTLSINPNFASLRLDPRNGSSVLDAQRGILGLNSDSDATGVGVQVLKADLSPMPLTEEVQMIRMQNGDIQIPMAARYIQIGKDAPVGGVANASVGFTLTYK
ncbi:type 1 fimbrial protein [Pseudomonas fakonensis]|uniref:Type 1 fimbrial protein n=1 Tax=Pseudomonas fakonensis TaxID=2842355 RepID=A0ABX8N5Q9_9PSED|nr:fimbrial protein [Pseudomonas fakonensis]QXH50712.1 type 1 fimbrial protein [Pseudomonas fakonensis]